MCASFAALQISVHLALVCDHVTTCHMLYIDKPQIQYSGVMYVSPREQCVFMQLFRLLNEGIHTIIKLRSVVEIMCFYD